MDELNRVLTRVHESIGFDTFCFVFAHDRIFVHLNCYNNAAFLAVIGNTRKTFILYFLFICF